MKKWIANILIIGIVLYVAMQIKSQYIVVAMVPSESMEPTISEGSYLLGIKTEHVNANFQRGDIILFEHDGEIYTKRIIGIPGDSLTIISGAVYINGDLYIEEYVKENWDVTREVYSYNIPLHKYFVMGDNRLNSEDSRQWGYISQKDVFAKVKWIVYPFHNIKKLY